MLSIGKNIEKQQIVTTSKSTKKNKERTQAKPEKKQNKIKSKSIFMQNSKTNEN